MSRPFLDRLSLDKVNLKLINENKQDKNGFALLKSSFFGQLGNNVKANLMMLAFCIPVIVWIFISQINQYAVDLSVPYSGNIGIGYPVINDAAALGASLDLQLVMKRALYMMPFIVVGSLGLAGLFNVVKYFCWGFQIKVLKTFMRGIKNSYAPFIWVGMMLAVCFVLISYVFSAFNFYTNIALGWRIAAYAGVVIVTLFVLLLSVYITTQATVFNLTLWEILKNSFHLSFRFLLQNALILIAGLITMVLPFLTFNSFVQIAAYMLFFLLGFSWTAMVWTIYTHSLYNIMYNAEEEKKQDTHKQGSGKRVEAKSARTEQNLNSEQDNTNKQAEDDTQKQGVKQHYRSPKKNKKN